MEEKDYLDILKQLTLEEKASLCSGDSFWTTKAIERLGIPSVRVSDGPNGLRREKDTGGTNVMQVSEPATCFPTAVTAASSWDEELLKEEGAAIANEALSLGVTTVLGPGVNIKRSPLCGRNFEYFSEDPFLAGRLGAAWVHGVQSNGVGTSLKHYLANSQEHLRMMIDSVVDERALREIYLPAFEHVVKTEQPTTVMCCYNRINGTYGSDNKYTNTDILRNEFGFKGIVVSDWGAVNDRVEGIRAGMDLEMPGNKGLNDKVIVKAVKEKQLSMEELDRVALRMIKFAFENKAKEKDVKANHDANNDVARRVAEGGAVLLRNVDKALPLKPEQNVAVIGALAKHMRYQGSGSSNINPTKLTTFLDAMNEAGQAYEYADGYTLKGDGYSKGLINKAKKIAEGKDAVLVFIGLTDAYESEGFDRKHLNLPDGHNILVDELLKVNPNIIVVLSGGAPMKISKWDQKVKAVLNLYLGGQAGGAAAYNLIYGKVNPSGKLAETFPYRNHDNIVSRYFPMGPRSVEYRESIYVGYRFFDTAGKEVAYPFGYGLSYTTFEYSDLKISAEKINEGDPLTVSFKVKNTGDVAGAEVAQLYVSDVESTIFRPKKELKGFKKVFLQPGEEKEITLELDSRAFAYYNVAIKDWHVESGDFAILVGASSQDIKLTGNVYVTSKNPNAQIPNYKETSPYYYNIATIENANKRIPHEEFEGLIGRTLVENKPFEKGEFTINNTVAQISVTGVGKFIYNLLTFGARLVAINSSNPGMIIESVKDLPIRGFCGFTGGIISAKSCEGVVDMCNGVKGGFKKFCRGFKKEKEEAPKEETK